MSAPGEDTSRPYELLRDGVRILIGTEGECWTYIHSHHCYSVSHALAHEGYEIVPVDLTCPIGPGTVQAGGTRTWQA